MKKNKKGFSLVELLVVIAIIGVLLLISFPIIDRLVSKNNQSKHDAYRDVVEEASKIYMDNLGFKVSGCYKLSDEALEEQGLLTGFGEKEDYRANVLIYSDAEGNTTDYKINLYKNKNLETKCSEDGYGECEFTTADQNACTYEIVQDQSAYGQNADFSGANAPQLQDKMIPVKYDGENWVVADQKNYKYSSVFEEDYSWYNYNAGYWANAVYVKEDAYSKYVTNDEFNMQKIVSTDDVLSWWVWIPRLAYKTTDSKEIMFIEKDNTKVPTGYALADAFIDPEYQDDATNQSLGKEYSKDYGFWIGKYELGKEGDDYVVKELSDENKYISHKTAKEFITEGKKIDGAHIIRSKEWDTVAMLSLSKYGKGTSGTGYTTDNNSGAYNMASKEAEFTAGNLRGLTNFNFKLTCNNSCDENGESIVTVEQSAENVADSTSGWFYRPFDKKNYCNPAAYDKATAVFACLGLTASSTNLYFISDNDVDVYNIDYYWYEGGSIVKEYTCTTGKCLYGPEGTVIKSKNIFDKDVYTSYNSFTAGYPRFTFTQNADGTWNRKQVYAAGQYSNAYLWVFKGPNSINFTSRYDDLTIDYDEMMENLNASCQPQLTCTDDNKDSSKSWTVYTSSQTKYNARTRVVIR